MKYKEIDIATWKRKTQYELFKTYEDPFFNITANVDVTELYDFSKKEKLSFFYCTLFTVMSAVNSVDELKCRIRANNIRQYENINAGSTFLHDDETFGFFYALYTSDIKEFCRNCQIEVGKVKSSKKLEPSIEDNDFLIHCSVLPWVNFTSIKHPRKLPVTDSIPKVVFGKYLNQNGRKIMPMSLDAHHALADGFHAAKFFDKFNEIAMSFV